MIRFFYISISILSLVSAIGYAVRARVFVGKLRPSLAKNPDELAVITANEHGTIIHGAQKR